jgi:hypothetical protein
MATETGEGTPEESTDADDPGDVAPEEDAPLTGDPASGTGTDGETEREEAYSQFTRSVIVTVSATLFGLAAGIGATLFATEMVGSTPQPQDLSGVAILAACVLAQYPLYSALGLEPENFETKTNLYVFAMTFFMWFITWTLLLTTRGLL